MNLTKPLPDSFRWSFQYFQQYPLQTLFVITILAIRYFFAVFFIYGFWHKLVKGWMWTDVMKVHFQQRLSEIPPDSFQATYLEYFAIPLHSDCVHCNRRRIDNWCGVDTRRYHAC